MKFNAYQKLILLVYGFLFVYFTIIHVPFRTSYRNEIRYDTLLSNSSNLDIGRLVLIIVILSILTIVLFLIFRNVSFSFKKLPKKTIRLVFYSTIVIIVFLATIFGVSKYKSKNKNIVNPIVNAQTIDSTSTLTDTSNSILIPSFLKYKYLYKGKDVDFADIQNAAKQSNLSIDSYIEKAGVVVLDQQGLPIPKNVLSRELKDVTHDSTSVSVDTSKSIDAPPFIVKRVETCTEEHALENFKSYMKFYYPDWKIYGKPVVKEQSDCTYRIQFTTLDPHIRYEREVIIVEISYNYDYSRYNFTTIRGTLY